MNKLHFTLFSVAVAMLLLGSCVVGGRALFSKTRRTAKKVRGKVGQTAERVGDAIARAKRFAAEKKKSRCPPKIRTGSLPESLESEEAFYGIRGGFDYERTPLTWPLSLMRLGTHGTIDLLWKTDIEVQDVRQIGKEGDWLFGEASPNQYGFSNGKGFVVAQPDFPSAGDRPALYFAYDTTTPEGHWFPSREAMDDFLARVGIPQPALRSSADILKAYMHHGILPFPP